MSVSRVAAAPQRGQSTCFQVGCRSSGLPGTSKLDILGQDDRQLVARDRNRAAALAMDDRDRRAPVALARNAPVAQAVLDGCRWPQPAASARRMTSAAACSVVSPSRKLRIDRDSGRALGLGSDRLGGDIGARSDDALDRQAVFASRIRSRAGRGRARRRSRRCHSPSARSSRCRPAGAIRDRAGGRPRRSCRSPSSPPSRSPRRWCRPPCIRR